MMHNIEHSHESSFLTKVHIEHRVLIRRATLIKAFHTTLNKSELQNTVRHKRLEKTGNLGMTTHKRLTR